MSGAHQALGRINGSLAFNGLQTLKDLPHRLIGWWSRLGVRGRIENLLRPHKRSEMRRAFDETLRRSVETNDLILRRVGADLHDGPAQLISLALLRLDSLDPRLRSQNAEASLEDFERIRGALVDSLTEIRNLSAGLALPELEALSPGDTLRIAVQRHERRTGTKVKCQIDELPHRLPVPLKAGLYRVVQEGLNNAFRHAEGAGQAVQSSCEAGAIQLVISDSGPGFRFEDEMPDGEGLGLKGMRDRVASLGGVLEIRSAPGEGTQLTASFKIADDNGVL